MELNATSNILTERKILERIEHPLIVNLRYAFHDEENLFMVLDLMLGGDLRFHLDRLGQFNELQVRFYVADLILSINYIHKQWIIHRDIKPDNVLLDSNGHAHLSDFNIATQITEQKPYRQNRAGSLIYMAPEILAEKKYTTDVDWWSLGVTAFELLYGRRPFKGKTNETLKQAILHDILEFPEDIQISSEGKDVIKGLLTKSPKHRLGQGAQGFEKLKSHSWFQGLDWTTLENKTANPPFIPNNNRSNFDAVHELEELLFEDVPLRAHKRREPGGAYSESMKDLLEMDDMFLPFDYTKHQSSTAVVVDMEEEEVDTTKITEDRRNSLTPSNLLRRVGGALDQNRYKSQGYHELTNTGEEMATPTSIEDPLTQKIK
ncbi:unnamed protein product [Mucor hiemalis]